MEVKTRTFKEHNYHSVWFDGKTLRQTLDKKKPIEELKFPEFYDVKITNKCGGGCPYCYQDSTLNEEHYPNLLKNFNAYFSPMSENERPFQIAIGGGEPTSHPDFLNLLELSDALGICPNYTTNGMWSLLEDTDKVQALLTYTKRYSGGVAVSCHPHLDRAWKEAVRMYSSYGIKTNLHVIISDKPSVDRFVDIFRVFDSMIDYIVLLPMTCAGRAQPTELAWDYLVEKMPDTKKIAFGANFYPYLKLDPGKFDVSLYEPEIMSGYLDMKDMKLYKSSFNLIEKFAEAIQDGN